MKRIILAGLLALAFIPVGASTVSAGADKVDICHDGDDGWELINVAAQGATAHVRHGDAAPGDEVPGTDGDTFGDDCSIIPASPFEQLCDSFDGQTDETEPGDFTVVTCSLSEPVPPPPDLSSDLVAACQAEAPLRDATLRSFGFSTIDGLLTSFRCSFIPNP